MSWPSPLVGYENADPLPNKVNADGKSLYNPPAPRSGAYDEYPKPIDSSNNPFDFHGALIILINVCFITDGADSVLHAIGHGTGRLRSEAP